MFYENHLGMLDEKKAFKNDQEKNVHQTEQYRETTERYLRLQSVYGMSAQLPQG